MGLGDGPQPRARRLPSRPRHADARTRPRRPPASSRPAARRPRRAADARPRPRAAPTSSSRASRTRPTSRRSTSGPRGTVAERAARHRRRRLLDDRRPPRARAIAARLAARGLAFLDAPVSGGQKGANEGTLTFFVGGDAAALEKARPVFEAMGKRITHLGPSGAGQLGKATNQVIVANTSWPSPRGSRSRERGPPARGAPRRADRRRRELVGARGPRAGRCSTATSSPPSRQAPAEGPRDRPARPRARTGVPLPGAALVHQLLSPLEAQGRGEDGTQALLRSTRGSPAGARFAARTRRFR